MYYNPREAIEIRQLTSLLQEENFCKILERLDSKGMRKGFACLFSGAPGTGKTETAYQIARETKRNIMMVDISETKSMWYGESEKKIKEVFDAYKALVESSEIAPILLFNEADAVIGKRKEFTSSSRAVDQTENTIQNIILQEMENLSGILIATTNLTQNMDRAFERRFLYKIKFDKPCMESRVGLWTSMLADLSETQARQLAGEFELSGGQIENIARKLEVDSILDGLDLSMDLLVKYCKDEYINGFNAAGKRIGFDA
jgi:SpoVK/Ycf46/Vps4 family AAA+-type ATPase